jgi:hypothetical protein
MNEWEKKFKDKTGEDFNNFYNKNKYSLRFVLNKKIPARYDFLIDDFLQDGILKCLEEIIKKNLLNIRKRKNTYFKVA